MFLAEFKRKLKKLNPSLRIDDIRKAVPYMQEYPTCGLYYNDKFVMGIPQHWVPEHTVAGVDLQYLERKGRTDVLQEMERTGFLPPKEEIEERLMWRGWKAILSGLVRQGYVRADQASKLFGRDIYSKRTEWPRTFIQYKPEE